VIIGGMRTGIEGLDVKADIEDMLIKTLTTIDDDGDSKKMRPVPCQVYLHTSFFYENLVVKGPSMRVFRESTPNSFVFRAALPSNISVPMVSSEDIGRSAASILLRTRSLSSSEQSVLGWCGRVDQRHSRVKSEKTRSDSSARHPYSVHQVPLIGDVVSGPAFAKEFAQTVSNQDHQKQRFEARYEAVPLTAMKGLDPRDLERLQRMYDWYSIGDG